MQRVTRIYVPGAIGDETGGDCLKTALLKVFCSKHWTEKKKNKELIVVEDVSLL